MLFGEELEIRYKKSSTTSMATTLSPLSVRIESFGFLVLFHSCVMHPCQERSRFFLSSGCNSHLECCAFNLLICTVEPVSICYYCIDGLTLLPPTPCRGFDLKFTVVCCGILLKQFHVMLAVYVVLNDVKQQNTNLYA